MSEFNHEERLSRQRAAERLADIAYALTVGGTLELRTGGDQVKVPVVDQVLLTRESRTDGDLVEVEVRLRWSARAADERGAAGSCGPGDERSPSGTRQ